MQAQVIACWFRIRFELSFLEPFVFNVELLWFNRIFVINSAHLDLSVHSIRLGVPGLDLRLKTTRYAQGHTPGHTPGHNMRPYPKTCPRDRLQDTFLNGEVGATLYWQRWCHPLMAKLAPRD